MHASKGRKQRLEQALLSAERSIHVCFRNKGAFECKRINANQRRGKRLQMRNLQGSHTNPDWSYVPKAPEPAPATTDPISFRLV